MSQRAMRVLPGAPSEHNPGPPSKRAKKKIFRHCYECGDRPARRLPGVEAGATGSVFCSLRCAAEAATDYVLQKGIRWCPIHRDWSDENGDCWACDPSIRVNLLGDESASTSQPATEKAVTNG